MAATFSKVAGGSAVALTLLCSQNPALAEVFYLDPTGNDQTGDGSSQSPWYSLSHACSAIAAGVHTIHINPGDYVDNASCQLPLGVSIEGAGRDLVTIRSSVSDWYVNAESSPIEDGNHRISGITLDGNDRTLDHGLRFAGRNSIKVEGCRFRNIRDKAINVEGVATDWAPPSGRITGVSIHDSDFTSCASHFQSDNSSGAIHVNATEGAELYNLVVDESATTGQCIKGVFGWNSALNLHDCVLTVGPQGATNGCVIEMWGHSNDSQIHHNVFYNGFVSLVSGDKDQGTWALTFHHNVLNNTSANECSVDDLHVHDNVLMGPSVPYNDNTACWNCFGFWPTWINSIDDLHNILVDHNIIIGASNSAIWFNFGVAYQDVRIYNNTIDATVLDGWVGAAIGLNAKGEAWANVDIANNIMINSDAYGVWTPTETPPNMSGVQIRNNLIHGSGTAPYSFSDTAGFSITNNLTEPPELVLLGDKPRPYYAPASVTANVVDVGLDVGLPYAGQAPDLGAIEFVVAPLDAGSESSPPDSAADAPQEAAVDAARDTSAQDVTHPIDAGRDGSGDVTSLLDGSIADAAPSPAASTEDDGGCSCGMVSHAGSGWYASGLGLLLGTLCVRKRSRRSRGKARSA